MANIKIAMLKENYPDKITEDGQHLIFEELGRLFHGTPKGEVQHLRTFRLEEDAHQESGQWLTKATDKHRLGSGVKLKQLMFETPPCS